MEQSIWKTLSAIDCNEHVDKKGQFSYLSWTWAWAMVKENYPRAFYRLLDDTVYPDGTMEVRVEVTVEELSHTMWLPVLDFKNRAISNPNAFDINSSRMRCLVKCLAMFGLGHYIYAGESVPQEMASEPFTAEQKATFMMLLDSEAALEYLEFTKAVGDDVTTALYNSGEKNKIMALKKRCSELEAKGHALLDALANEISVELSNDDFHAFHMASETFEIGPFIKKALWGRLSKDEQDKLVSMKEQAQ